MIKVAIFDFCETLCDFQTADAYIDYVRKHCERTSIRQGEHLNSLIRKLRVVGYIDSHTHYKHSLYKRLKLLQAWGIPQDLMEELAFGYYTEEIKPHLIEETIKRLRYHQKVGDEVWLISGGYSIYLQHFANEYGIKRLISSKIAFSSKGYCKGKLEGRDCMNKNKVLMLKSIIGTEDVLEIVASYSDSYTDIPILSVAKDAYVISRKHQQWADQYNFKEIIWT